MLKGYFKKTGPIELEQKKGEKTKRKKKKLGEKSAFLIDWEINYMKTKIIWEKNEWITVKKNNVQEI